MPYTSRKLDNQLHLLTVPMPGVQSVTAMLLVAAGSRYEAADINGLSHFLEHMAFKGSKKRPSALAISSEIDSIGGEFNAFTGKDHTGFYIKAAGIHLPILVDVLADMILNPLLKEEEIEREKGVIIEEIHMYEDTPMRHIGDIFEQLIFGETPLGRDTAGKPEVIKAINRAHFCDYIDRLYRPNNATLIIAGKAQPEGTAKLVEESLSDWQKQPVEQYLKQSDKQFGPRLLLQHKATEQAHLALGVPAYSLFNPRRHALSVLTAILGGGMSSRLFIEVRERRGLAYYVHADAQPYQDVGYFVTQAGVDVTRIDDAVKVIIEQYLQVSQKKLPITIKELQKAKEYIKGRHALELEDSRSVAAFYGTQEILKREIITPSEYISKIESVTLDDVQGVAQEIFQPPNLNLAIIGPYKEEERFKKLLKV